MITAPHAYHYTTNGRPAADSDGEPIGPALLAPMDDQLKKLTEVVRDRPVWAQDLLQVARAVFMADKLSLRAGTDDRWTRRIDLSVQVADVDAWTQPAVALLNRLTEMLTSDRWTIRVRPGAAVWPQQNTVLAAPRVDEVALFSGGLDSSAYAAERARTSGGELLLVSYYEPQWGMQQDHVLTTIHRSSARDIRQFKTSQQVRAQQRELEPSARTRGLLYAATAVYLAAAHDVPRVVVPENGQLALNPALTPARGAACSTRSVHPHTLYLLNQLIAALGGSVTVVNPYLHLTKGEVCQRALDAGLPPATLTGTTLSCGRPPRDRPELHCGCCYPCLVRRSGLLAALGADDTPYAKDVWTVPDDLPAAVDRRALHRWLSRRFGVRDLVTDMPLPDDLDLAPLLEVVQRGRVELKNLFARQEVTATQRQR